jgi:hypothetical protein
MIKKKRQKNEMRQPKVGESGNIGKSYCYMFEWLPEWEWYPTTMTDTTDATHKYYVNWYPDEKSTQCPICGKWVFGLLEDNQKNKMCIECYKEIYGSDC